MEESRGVRVEEVRKEGGGRRVEARAEGRLTGRGRGRVAVAVVRGMDS